MMTGTEIKAIELEGIKVGLCKAFDGRRHKLVNLIQDADTATHTTQDYAEMRQLVNDLDQIQTRIEEIKKKQDENEVPW